MRKFLIAFVVVGLVRNLPLYGYPSVKELLKHLLGIGIDENGKRTEVKGGLTTVFQKAFNDVYESAKESDFKNLALFGEKFLNDNSSPGQVNQESGTKQERKMVESSKGYFACRLFGHRDVFTRDAFNEAVSSAAKGYWYYADEKAFARVCRVLVSEDFARKILTDAFVKAFLKNKDKTCSYVGVDFIARRQMGSVFCFTVRYKQWLDSHADVLFRFNYDVEGGRFGEGEVRVGKYFLISRFDFSWCLTSVDYGTKDLKDALKELEEGKWDEYITEGEEETDKTDEISEKTQGETPKQEQKLEECKAKNPKTNNQHEGKSKENEEKKPKLSLDEETIRNKLSEINEAVKSIRFQFMKKRVFSLKDTGSLICDIRKLEEELKALSMNIEKVNSDKKKEIFKNVFGRIQKNIENLLADIGEYRRKCRK